MTLIDVSDMPVDYDLTKLEDPEELLKFKKEIKREPIQVNSYYEPWCEENELAEYDITPDEYERYKQTTLSGLLDSEINGIKVNSLEGLPFFFNQLMDRILIYLKTEIHKNPNGTLVNVHGISLEGDWGYEETDEQLKKRIASTVASKIQKRNKVEKQKKQALQQLRASGFDINEQGAVVKIKKSKKQK